MFVLLSYHTALTKVFTLDFIMKCHPWLILLLSMNKKYGGLSFSVETGPKLSNKQTPEYNQWQWHANC